MNNDVSGRPKWVFNRCPVSRVRHQPLFLCMSNVLSLSLLYHSPMSPFSLTNTQVEHHLQHSNLSWVLDEPYGQEIVWSYDQAQYQEFRPKTALMLFLSVDSNCLCFCKLFGWNSLLCFIFYILLNIFLHYYVQLSCLLLFTILLFLLVPTCLPSLHRHGQEARLPSTA